MNTPLYRRLLGDRFDDLPEPVRRLHSLTAELTVFGEAEVRRGTTLASRLIGRLLGLPAAGTGVPLQVRFAPRNGREHWVRHYDGKAMTSIQWQHGEFLNERLGPLVLRFHIHADGEGLSLQLREVRCLGVPLPRGLHPRVRAVETAVDGRFRFDVSASLPLVGFVVHYQGELRHE